jgi:hypothetical protein
MVSLARAAPTARLGSDRLVMPASCTSPIHMRSSCRVIFANRGTGPRHAAGQPPHLVGRAFQRASPLPEESPGAFTSRFREIRRFGSRRLRPSPNADRLAAQRGGAGRRYCSMVAIPAGHRFQHDGRRHGRGGEPARYRRHDRIGNSPMAKRHCARTSNASRANSWRRTSISPKKPHSTAQAHSTAHPVGFSNRP